VDPGPHGDPAHVAVDAVELTAALGREPTVLRASGHADERILEAADSERVALVAVGSRGLSGVRALGSVSERVAHRAPCSVLVARTA
jgi:nucleotide-binding universal stress UspA family protein